MKARHLEKLMINAGNLKFKGNQGKQANNDKYNYHSEQMKLGFDGKSNIWIMAHTIGRNSLKLLNKGTVISKLLNIT